ncbi:hypothetical protein Ais01nite_39380 [Asanoa ishikariensis]|uniref:Uncharacterized protein n=1 Tax=Asanoa ishikariensis TaxID=137265 RepID=A0A1H3M492_9ACTN|nr:hypothetical protein Ais01nite_39380 [Asanoa ishikariensis]SDY71547.1 hypothetical protein SAMN05421684_1178 [Asanoa ishikariensis]
MNGDGVDRVGIQPSQGKLVRCGEQHDDVGGAATTRGELDRGVCQLGGLVTGREVGSGDEVEAAALWVRHVFRVGG